MADRIEPFAVLVGNGTTQAAPQTQGLTFDEGIVTQLHIMVPPGPSGLMGFQILFSGQSVIPYSGDQYLIYDNIERTWPLSNFPTSGDWAIRAYNGDVWDHTIYLEFLIDEVPISVDTVRIATIL
jgi:hypothetical protein